MWLKPFPRVNWSCGPSRVDMLLRLSKWKLALTLRTVLLSSLTLSNRYLFIHGLPLVKRNVSPGSRRSSARRVWMTPARMPQAPLLFTSFDGTLTDIIAVGEVPTHPIMVVKLLSRVPPRLSLKRLLTIIRLVASMGGINRAAILRKLMFGMLVSCLPPAL